MMMLDTNQQRKNKISLEDYDYKQDIENRLLMAQFSSTHIEVLEEILYSSIKIPLRKLAKSVDVEEDVLLPILEQLSKTGLCAFEEDSVRIDKDVRKYFESQIVKFDSDFKPGMEFLQGILKKVPIHVLPVWYAIPRTSNNIFDSLVEKHLLTPQIFHRYLSELHFPDPVMSHILGDVYNAPDFKIYAQDLIDKYNLSREVFEEYILHLEFHFVCCLGYEKIGDDWKEIVTPFHEWREYLQFLKSTETSPLPSPEQVQRKRPHDFSFIQDMTILLTIAKKHPLPLSDRTTIYASLAQKMDKCDPQDPAFHSYFDWLLTKVCLLKLADVVDGRLYALDAANDWLDMRLENKAHQLHRHPLNKILSKEVPQHLCTERTLRESEKSICRVLTSGWVYFDDFIKGVIVPISEHSVIMLKKQGKMWRYTIPSYTEEERALLKAIILEWLFELGITAIGTHKGKECFCVTSFGQALFGR